MNLKKFENIVGKIKKLKFKEKYTIVIGIGKGGIVPAYLISEYLSLPLEIIWVNFRDKNNNIQRVKPKLMKPLERNYKNEKILLVDDRVKTGRTFDFMKELLKDAKYIKTLVVNGSANYSLYDEDCFNFPWRL